MRGVLHRQVAAALHLHVVVASEVDLHLCPLVNVDVEQHVHSAQCHLFLLLGGDQCVVEVGKGDHASQAVFHRQGRLLQHVGRVGVAQYLHAAADDGACQLAFDGGEEGDEHPPVKHRVAVLLGIEQFVFDGSHLQVGPHVGKVAQVDATRQCDGIFPFGIDGEVVECQVVVGHVYGSLVNAQVKSVEGRVHLH